MSDNDARILQHSTIMGEFALYLETIYQTNIDMLLKGVEELPNNVRNVTMITLRGSGLIATNITSIMGHRRLLVDNLNVAESSLRGIIEKMGLFAATTASQAVYQVANSIDQIAQTSTQRMEAARHLVNLSRQSLNQNTASHALVQKSAQDLGKINEIISIINDIASQTVTYCP